MQKLDDRYSVTLEWCGLRKPRWVARFCGEWIGQGMTREEAHKLALAYEARRWQWAEGAQAA